MEEALEIVEGLADFGLESTLLRILGFLLLLAGVGTYLFVDVSVLIPALLAIGGLVLLLFPGVLVFVSEVFA